MRTALIATTTMFTGLLMCGHALAQATLTLTATSGRPTATVPFSGTGFADGEAVDIYVDTVDTQLLVSSAKGTLSGHVTLPASTQPGSHYITAIGRHSGDAAQAAYDVTTPWFEGGFGGAHLSWNPWENTLNASAVPSLGPAFATLTDAVYSSPVVVNGHVYVAGASGGVQAFSSGSAGGSPYWKALTTAVFDSTPAVTGNTLFVASLEGTMYALNATSGAQIWATAGGGGFASSPVVSGGLAFVGCDDSKLYAFETTTTAHTTGGAVLWTYTTGAEIYSSPAVVNNTVYAGSVDGKLYAISTAGALIWSYATGGPIESSPAVSGGLVYVGSNDGKLYAIKADSGALAWTATTGSAIESSPAVAYGLVYVGSNDGDLYAFNAHTGALAWAANFGGAFAFAGPSVADGIVYAASEEGTLIALQATTGVGLWTFGTASAGYSNPAISDGVVYFNSGDGYTYALAPNAGTSVLKRRQHPPAISTLRRDMNLRVDPLG
jgi:outer membrane protein assembly factor BamB